MEIKKFNDSLNIIWDELVEKSKNGIFLFFRNYMDYHKERFKDHSLVIFKKDKVVALFPANENGEEIFSHGGLTFGSLIMSYDLKAAEVLEIFNLIKHYYRELGFKQIVYKAIPAIYHKYPAEEDLYSLFRLNARLVRRDISSVIKLNNKIRFSESKRQAVTKCEKNNVTFSENSDFEEYWNLLTEVLSKFDTKPVHTLAEIVKLKENFPENIRLFEGREGDVLLAGVVIYDYDNVVHTQYMANSKEGRKIGALDFINHHLIEDIFKERSYFSFGISTEKQGRELNSGLIQQKEMMGSRGVALDFYNISLE